MKKRRSTITLPITRHYGSKRNFVKAIWSAIAERGIEFDSILDLFGGSGIVSYYMATKGKRVIFNDVMGFCCEMARALLCTPRGTLSEDEALQLLIQQDNVNYRSVVADNFEGIYYLPQENHQIDVAIQNICRLPEEKRAAGLYILIQACLMKRPKQLFHRRDLCLRTDEAFRDHTNHITWEKSFEELFVYFAEHLNRFQFDVLPDVKITNTSALDNTERADLVYIDPPYFNSSTPSASYHTRYHFLEGLLHYDIMENYINHSLANHRVELGRCAEFKLRKRFVRELTCLLEHHKESIIALSYRADGYPSIEVLCDLVARFKPSVEAIALGHQGYGLKTITKGHDEMLIIGR